jgi:hypothetical protein
MNGELRIRWQEGALQLHASVDHFNFLFDFAKGQSLSLTN